MRHRCGRCPACCPCCSPRGGGGREREGEGENEGENSTPPLPAQVMTSGWEEDAVASPLRSLPGVLPVLLTPRRWREAAAPVAAALAGCLQAERVMQLPHTRAAAVASVLALRCHAAAHDVTPLLHRVLCE